VSGFDLNFWSAHEDNVNEFVASQLEHYQLQTLSTFDLDFIRYIVRKIFEIVVVASSAHKNTSKEQYEIVNSASSSLLSGFKLE